MIDFKKALEEARKRDLEKVVIEISEAARNNQNYVSLEFYEIPQLRVQHVKDYLGDDFLVQTFDYKHEDDGRRRGIKILWGSALESVKESDKAKS